MQNAQKITKIIFNRRRSFGVIRPGYRMDAVEVAVDIFRRMSLFFFRLNLVLSRSADTKDFFGVGLEKLNKNCFYWVMNYSCILTSN